MKNKGLIMIGLMSIMAVLLSSCGMVEKSQESIDKTLLAKVGGESITQKDVDDEAQSYIDTLVIQYGDEALETEEGKEVVLQLKKDVLNSFVDMKVLDIKAKEAGIDRESDEIQEKVDERINSIKGIYGEEEEKYKDALKEMGYTEETYREYVEDEIVRNSFMDDMVKDLEVTDEEAEKYYNENKDSFVNPAGAKIYHIYFGEDDEAKAKAEEVSGKIKNDGEDFTDMAIEFGQDASRDKGGELGFFPYENNELYPDFMEHVKKLEENEISEVVQSTSGYHIIKVTDVQSEEVQKTYEESEEQIKNTLLENKKRELYEANMKEWKEELKVKVHEDKIS
ncbi:MAG: hypothetical protein GX752_04250 [Clostridium sp.]|nr:hypothetical protein [Clostridium sp.]